ncbi:putative thiol oxidoreductase [Largemouth bass virus]|uniref:Sulfhydryl oxidase n=1 Tax=Largemouth bass virus TaxID=176656 RepID=A0A9E7TN40_9VIRU|nr:putative thiol oxidoreductase [Largemouth bass virus]WAK75135.1 putative thiol oxidoreductase [Mandarin fish ranavirus]WEI29023.1 putative thiol oxidoreductase [Largemouth bass virus]WHA35590.1 putative thiol oxidoreductase [Micropterus salmoides ranavirus]WHA35695.1 putative thiol oxidoreductase [Siniperca chuatsi ranavirus]
MQSCNCTVRSTISTTFASTLDNGPFGPSGFGPAMWFTIHNGAAEQAIRGQELSPAEKRGWEEWLRNLWVCVPCHSCKSHYKAMVSQVDFTRMRTGYDVFKLTVDMHNMVNARLKKPHITLHKAKHLYGVDTKLGPPVTLTYQATTYN